MSFRIGSDVYKVRCLGPTHEGSSRETWALLRQTPGAWVREAKTAMPIGTTAAIARKYLAGE